MDAESWLTLCKWAVVAGGLVATLGGAGVWYFDGRVAHQRAPAARPLATVVAPPPGAPGPLAAAPVPLPEAPAAPAPGRPEVVRALELRIAIEAADGLPGEGSGPAEPDGARNVVTLVLADRTRLRFVSDAGAVSERPGPDRRRLSFRYHPETPSEILGRDVAALGAVEVMAVDYRHAFRRAGLSVEDGPTDLSLTVVVNGTEAGRVDHRGAPGLLGGTPAILDVSEAFAALRGRARP